MKQTAVEWLVKEFSEILGPLKTKPMQDLLIVDAIKQAKLIDEKNLKRFHFLVIKMDLKHKKI